MASLQRRSSGLYLVTFRYGQLQVQRSLETKNEAEAAHFKSAIERRLELLREGTLQLPPGATADELWQVVRHGRVLGKLPELLRSVALGAAAQQYLESYPAGSKEVTTLETEAVHLNHFKRLLGAATHLHKIQADDLQRYIAQRQQETGNRGGTIRADTIRKELQTFRLAWFFAKRQRWVSGDCPLEGVQRPKKRRKPPFQTWEQIERRIDRGGLSEREIQEMWECLYLRESEIAEFLVHVKCTAADSRRFRFIYGALCFCAYTGARRSEMFRCLIDDVCDGWIMLREKKKDRAAEFTFRQIPLNRELKSILDEWLLEHPGGQFLFCKARCQPLEDRTSREAFKAVTTASKWNALRGYHVLRHSFASNLARSGRVSQPEIDELMGHQTEDMRLRYRHLFPEDKRRAVEVLNFSPKRA